MIIKKINEMDSWDKEYTQKITKCLLDDGVEQENAIKIVDILINGKVNINNLIKSLEKVADITSSMYGIFK